MARWPELSSSKITEFQVKQLSTIFNLLEIFQQLFVISFSRQNMNMGGAYSGSERRYFRRIDD